MITDEERLDFIAQQARMSRIGISFVWYGSKPHTGYTFITHEKSGSIKPTIREAIDSAINERKPK